MGKWNPVFLCAGLLCSFLPIGCDESFDGDDQYVTYRVNCVAKINAYRSTLSLPPYARWVDAESCADTQAMSDSQAGNAHDAFGQCDEAAQNECPGWDSLNSTVSSCLDLMWAEGPGENYQEHGHYLAMSSTNYTKVACGFYETPSGAVWAIQNFR